MKLQTVFSLLIFFAAPSAFARARIFVGNGGHTVECRDSQGAVTSRFAFDLYEGSALFGYSYVSNVNPEQFALQLARKIDAALEVANQDVLTLEQRVRYVIDKKILLPPGVGLNPTEDTQEFIRLPSNCALVQTINFRNSNNVYINSDIWNALSPVNQAALYLHEAIYWYMREPGIESDSRRTRRAVAYLIAGGELIPPSQRPAGLKAFQYCHSTNRDSNGDWMTRFIAYRSDDRQPVLQFLQLDGYPVLTLTTLKGNIPGGVPSLPIKSSRLSNSNVSGQLSSELDIDAIVKLTWGNNKIGITGIMQPGSALRAEIVCESARAK